VCDRPGICPLAFLPVVREQKAAALDTEPVDQPSAPGRGALKQAVIRESQQVGVKLVAAAEGQGSGDLAGIVPASIAERFEHLKLQFAALSHATILTAFVSTPVFAAGTRGKLSGMRELAKASTFEADSRSAGSETRSTHRSAG
jgi:hypothetical protein